MSSSSYFFTTGEHLAYHLMVATEKTSKLPGSSPLTVVRTTYFSLLWEKTVLSLLYVLLAYWEKREGGLCSLGP